MLYQVFFLFAMTHYGFRGFQYHFLWPMSIKRKPLNEVMVFFVAFITPVKKYYVVKFCQEGSIVCKSNHPWRLLANQQPFPKCLFRPLKKAKSPCLENVVLSSRAPSLLFKVDVEKRSILLRHGNAIQERLWKFQKESLHNNFNYINLYQNQVE